VLPRPRVKDTRAELVKHFSDGRFVHQTALFAPSRDKVATWIERYSSADPDEVDDTPEASSDRDGENTAAVAEDLAGNEGFEEPAGSYAVAAE
jgi:ParB family chromosome partitioning protein